MYIKHSGKENVRNMLMKGKSLTNHREFFGAYKIPEVSNDSENLHDDTKWLQAKTGLIQSNDMDIIMIH